MGVIDVSCKAFFSNSRNFADLMNGVVFGGHAVVDPEDLEDMDTERVSEEEEKSYFVDVAKRWTINEFQLSILAIENQSYIDYGMVVRNMVTEALGYRKQLKDIQNYHTEKKDIRGDEYLSGVSRADMLVPIITVVVYLGEKVWNGPRELYDMLDMDERLKPYVYNYSLNLFDYHSLENTEIFDGQIVKLVDALKARGNKELVQKFVKDNRYLEMDTARLIGNLLAIKGIEKNIVKTLKGDMSDMCKGMEELTQEYYQNGMERGMEQGMERGIEKGLERGKQDTIVMLVQDGLLEAAIAAEKLGMKESEFIKILQERDE